MKSPCALRVGDLLGGRAAKTKPCHAALRATLLEYEWLCCCENPAAAVWRPTTMLYIARSSAVSASKS